MSWAETDTVDSRPPLAKLDSKAAACLVSGTLMAAATSNEASEGFSKATPGPTLTQAQAGVERWTSCCQ